MVNCCYKMRARSWSQLQYLACRSRSSWNRPLTLEQELWFQQPSWKPHHKIQLVPTQYHLSCLLKCPKKREKKKKKKQNTLAELGFNIKMVKNIYPFYKARPNSTASYVSLFYFQFILAILFFINFLLAMGIEYLTSNQQKRMFNNLTIYHYWYIFFIQIIIIQVEHISRVQSNL